MIRLKLIITLFFAMSCIRPSVAQESTAPNDANAKNSPTLTIDTLSVRVHFPQGDSDIDTTYRYNGSAFANLRTSITQAAQAEMLRSIEVRAWASPEGTTAFNEKLVNDRTEVLTSWILENTAAPSNLVLRGEGGVAWDALREKVAVANLPYRTQVLRILDGEKQERKQQLEKLDNGEVWWDLSERFFPDLRCCHIVVVRMLETQPEIIDHTADSLAALAEQQRIADSLAAVAARQRAADSLAALEALRRAEEATRNQKHTFPVALKTNALMDLALVPNVGVEVNVGKGWTVGLNGMFAWWDIAKEHYYWRIYGGDVNVRKYIGKAARRRTFTGHHLGLYGQILTYDFQLGGKGIMGGKPGGTILDKFSYGGGIEYGYALPITPRWNMDFTLGLGYLGGEYREYKPIDDCDVWLTTKKRQWFGPTKAEVSFVWILGKDKKGGSK